MTRTQLRPFTLSVLFAGASALTAGCALQATTSAPGSATPELAAAGADGTDTEANLESMSQVFVGGSGSSLTLQSSNALSPGHDGAAGVVPHPIGGFYAPAGCLVDEGVFPGTRTYTFNDCTGPLGLLHLTGVVTVVSSVTSAGALSLAFSAEDFHINAAVLSSWQATGIITATGEQRDMVWSGTIAGTTGSGRPFSRTNNKNIAWTVGGDCLTINGTSTGTITGLDLETTLTNYTRCADACPAASSEVTVKDLANGESIDVKYLGGNEAQFTGVDGQMTDFTLACGL